MKWSRDHLKGKSVMSIKKMLAFPLKSAYIEFLEGKKTVFL